MFQRKFCNPQPFRLASTNLNPTLRLKGGFKVVGTMLKSPRDDGLKFIHSHKKTHTPTLKSPLLW